MMLTFDRYWSIFSFKCATHSKFLRISNGTSILFHHGLTVLSKIIFAALNLTMIISKIFWNIYRCRSIFSTHTLSAKCWSEFKSCQDYRIINETNRELLQKLYLRFICGHMTRSKFVSLHTYLFNFTLQ